MCVGELGNWRDNETLLTSFLILVINRITHINNLREEAVLFCTMAFQRYFVHYSVYSGKQCIIENFTPQHSGPEAGKGGYW